MKKYFSVNYQKLVVLLTPTFLRSPLILAFLSALVAPIDYLYSSFMRFRDANLYHLDITPQVCFMEKVLNDRFDRSERRIFISDGERFDQMYLYTQSEALDEYIYLPSEGYVTYLFTSAETGAETVDFIVSVPQSLQFNAPEMSAVIDLYKLASKTYKIARI
ncbi:hypothetical protein [Dysgonomonas sp. ZJ279]|uniref:hypothetical protein n=1 Tax=Dysgonomonas sp. ZJ279 TaxID=2709796 RepID=UPI0013EBAF30|nr:hypothetical protein [Dysgonomonas sp. ZJ279]